MTDETKAREGEVTQAAAIRVYTEESEFGPTHCVELAFETREEAEQCFDWLAARPALSSATPAEDVDGPYSAETRYDHGDDSERHMVDHEDGDHMAEASSLEFAQQIAVALNALAALASIQPPPDVAQKQAEIERLREERDAALKDAVQWSKLQGVAEAKLAEAVEALTPWAAHDVPIADNVPDDAHFMVDTLTGRVVTIGQVRRVRTTLARIEETSRG